MTYGDAFEYQILREELISLKNCITNYVGFVIGGSGLGLLGISLSVGTSVNQNLLLISTFTLSLIISIVMLVIMYKFTSHNRMAGYCKLLSHEQVIPSENSKHDPEYVLQSYTNSFSWEICLDRLRESDLNPSNLINLLKELQYSGCEHERMKERIEYFTGPTPKSDEKKFQKGVLLFVKTLSGNLKTSSWSFPSPVLVIIFILSSFFFLYVDGVLLNIPDVQKWFE